MPSPKDAAITIGLAIAAMLIVDSLRNYGIVDIRSYALRPAATPPVA